MNICSENSFVRLICAARFCFSSVQLFLGVVVSIGSARNISTDGELFV